MMVRAELSLVGERDRRGSALVSVVMLASVLGTLSLSALTLGTTAMREQQSERQVAGVRYLAEAGLSQAVFDLSTGGNGNVGTEQAPVAFSGGTFWVDRFGPASAEHVRLIATAELDGSIARHEVLLRGQRVSPYRWAAFADESMSVSDDAFIDSYDPDAGSYAEQATNSFGGVNYAASAGHVGSNADILIAHDVQVHGDARSGPGEATTVEATAFVSGSTAPRDNPIPLPEVDVPSFLTLPALTVPTLLLLPVLPGNWSFAGLDVGYRGTLFITGPATVVFGSLQMADASQIAVDATLGPVEIYVLGDFVLGRGAQITSSTRDPADIAIYLAGDNVADTSVTIDFDGTVSSSDAKIYGTVYAPRAALDIRKNFRLFGSLAARRLRLGGTARVHYDEGIEDSRGGVSRKFETVAWRVLPIHD